VNDEAKGGAAHEVAMAAMDKSHVHLHETVIELTLLAFLKSAVKKNEIDQ